MINQESDKFYDDDGANDDVALQQISNVLNSCQSYSVQELNEVTIATSTTQFSTYFINIDGNGSNFDTLLAELNRIKHKFSIIGIAETNTDEPLNNLYNIPGYNSFYQNTLEGKCKGTGVALYVANHLNAEVIEKLGYCSPDIESLFVRISQPSKNFSLTAGVIYRPPNGNHLEFGKEFDHICNQLPSSGVRIIGDFNIDLLKLNNLYGSGSHTRFEESFIKAGMTPVISIPTHLRANCKPSCIDNIFTNDIDRVALSGSIKDQIGDHLPIFEITNIELDNDSKNEKHVKYYDFCNENLNKFVEILEHEFSQWSSVSNKFTDFTDIFGRALDTSCKLVKPKTTKRTPANNPWITDSITLAIEKKHQLKDDWAKTINKQHPGGDDKLYKGFTNYRRVLKYIINSAKNLYKSNKILENIHDRKKTWQMINELRGKSKKSIKPAFVIDNKKITDRRIIANEFNKYFNSIASKLNEAIIGCDLLDSKFKSFEDFLLPSNEKSIFLDDCTSTELLEIISNLDDNKASDIPIRAVKKSAHIICPILSAYFNTLMADGIFPDVLKVGKVTPIFKKGNLEDIGNYRPVSTLPIFGKIFEKVIYSRIYSFALSQNILDKNQFGFRKSHSTSHAVNYSVKIIEDSIKKQNHVLGIFIDLSKAFDTIDHDILLTKLNRYGIRGSANNLIKSYLSKRIQYTEVLGEKSDPLIVKYGVPQGSVLGPLLFLLYINDISNCSNLGTFILFADDTNIFVEGDSADDAYRKGNTLLASLNKYMILNRLHINMSKCCYIHFKPKASTPVQAELQLSIEDIPINRTSTAKFLGVIIDEQLSWEPHITALKRKLNYASATLCRIRDSIPSELHTDLYHTLFESHLSYCISVWGDAALLHTTKIWMAQKHCIRVLFGDKIQYLDKFKTCARARPHSNQLLGSEFFQLEHCKPLFKKFKILAFRNLRTYHTFMETFKILKLRCPMSLYEQYHLSHRKEITLIASHPTKDFLSRSTNLWNTVAPKLKLLDYSHSISQAKSCLKATLLNMQHANDEIAWLSDDFDIQKMPAISRKIK